MTDDEVLTERDGAILVITLNRPKARNAVNSALARGLAAAVDTLDGDPELSSASSPARAARSAPGWT